ncbi:archaeosortase/exosortase family protein [bacterium SCSIO 12741]|nr:archaeosortase/exosortase family protein [bacterium SCSIO 12741]
MKLSTSNPLIRFLVFSVLLYVLWYVLYELWIHPQGAVDAFAINQIVEHARFILEAIGYRLNPDDVYAGEFVNTIGILGTAGVWIGDPCNGITLFALFTGFILAFPGPIRRKLWFIPMGILSIHLLNVIRVVALVIVSNYWPETLDFNHTYTFTILVYSYVFLLWYLWATKYSQVDVSKA